MKRKLKQKYAILIFKSKLLLAIDYLCSQIKLCYYVFGNR